MIHILEIMQWIALYFALVLCALYILLVFAIAACGTVFITIQAYKWATAKCKAAIFNSRGQVL